MSEPRRSTLPRCLLALTVLALALVPAATALAGKPAVPPKAHPETAGWDDLLKGDLSNADYPKEVWSFEDGVLTATKDQNLWTKQTYDNFILDLEFKTAEGTNSGVVVHCSDTGNWIPNSIEVQIADDYSKEWSSKPRTWQCAAIFGHLAAKENKVVKEPGHWNRMTVTCKGPMVWVMLNGKQVTEMDMRKWTSAKKNPDGSEIPPWLSKPVAELPTKGHIGFQGKHAGAPIWFRNLKIKTLPAD